MMQISMAEVYLHFINGILLYAWNEMKWNASISNVKLWRASMKCFLIRMMRSINGLNIAGWLLRAIFHIFSNTFICAESGKVTNKFLQQMTSDPDGLFNW